MITRQLFVTGFGPFGDVTFNPSGPIARALGEQPPLGWNVKAAELPVTFDGAPLAIDAALSELTVVPDLLLGLGVHRGHTFRLERRARALAGAHEADRATSIELRAQAVVLLDAGAGAVTISNDAGQYVCECAYLHLLTRAQGLGVPALFLHVPPDHALPHVQQTTIVRAWLSVFNTT